MNAMRVNEIFSDSRRLLVAVESVDLQRNQVDTSLLMHGSLNPVAIVVCDLGSTYAFDMEAKPVAVDELRQDLPDLDTAICAFENKVKNSE